VTSGDTNTTVTFTGTGFIAGSQIALNGSNLTTTYTSSTTISCTVSTATIATLIGQVSEFKVTNGTPGGGTSNRATFRGLGGTYPLPNKAVFDVTSYGALGDNVHDDTVAIRSTKAAAHTAGGGIVYFPAGSYACQVQNGESPIYGFIFNFVSGDDNIAFCGSYIATLTQGASQAMPSKLLGYVNINGVMSDPKKNWYPLSASSGAPIGRFTMLNFDFTGSISGVQFRSLEVNGNSGWTGNYYNGGDVIGPTFDAATTGHPATNSLQFSSATILSSTQLFINSNAAWLPNVVAGSGTLTVWDSSNSTSNFYKVSVSAGGQSGGIWTFTISAITAIGSPIFMAGDTLGVSDGDGWDVWNKGLRVNGDSGHVSGTNYLVWNCDFRNWRGEEIYCGGNVTNVFQVIQTNVRSCNSSAISLGANQTIDHCILGGPGNDQISNGIEPFLYTAQGGATGSSSVTYNLIQNFGSGGVWCLGQPGASFLIDHNTFLNFTTATSGGVGLSEAPCNVTVSNNTFTNGGPACIWDIWQGLPYPGVTNNASNWAINNNTFDPYNGTVGLSRFGYDKQNVIITGLTFSGNETKSGMFLHGNYSFNTTNVPGTFTVDSTKIDSGAAETNWYGPSSGAGVNKVAKWTNSNLPAWGDPHFYYSGSEPIENFGGGNGPIPAHWTTDRQICGNNSSTGAILLDLDTDWYGAYPDGYSCTFYGGLSGTATWSLNANAAWNTWGSPQPVPTNGTGLTIYYSVSTGKFGLSYVP
jgi:hypothetical protein